MSGLLSQTEQAIKESEEKLNAIKPALEESRKINDSMLEQNSDLATRDTSAPQLG